MQAFCILFTPLHVVGTGFAQPTAGICRLHAHATDDDVSASCYGSTFPSWNTKVLCTPTQACVCLMCVSRSVLPVGALFALVLWAGNAAYMYLSVSFIQMLKVRHRACTLQSCTHAYICTGAPINAATKGFKHRTRVEPDSTGCKFGHVSTCATSHMNV